jgi:hypothetical protein
MATFVKIFSSISTLSYTPLLESRLKSRRKAPLFYQKSASFLLEKRLISGRKEALFFLALLGLFGR